MRAGIFHPRTFFFPVTQQLIASGVIQNVCLLLMISVLPDKALASVRVSPQILT